MYLNFLYAPDHGIKVISQNVKNLGFHTAQSGKFRVEIKTMRHLLVLLIKFCVSVICTAICIVGVAHIAMQGRESRAPEDVAPLTGRFVKTTDAKIFVQQKGPKAGAPIVLIHGMGAWSEIWRDDIDMLASRGYRVTAMDLPPFGYSQRLSGAYSYSTDKQAKRLLDVLTSKQIERPVIVCHSYGCRPVLEAVLQAPDRFSKLVLVDPYIGMSDDLATPHFQQPVPQDYMRLFFDAGHVRDAVFALVGTNPLLVKVMYGSTLSDKAALTDARVTTLKRPLVVKNTTRAVGDLIQYLETNPESSRFAKFDTYKTIQIPVLIVWGHDDPVSPVAEGEALQGLFPQAELSVIRGAGHAPFIEQSENFQGVLSGFLAKP